MNLHTYRKKDRLTASFISPVNDPLSYESSTSETSKCVSMQIACMENHVEVGYPRFWIWASVRAAGLDSHRPRFRYRKSSGRASHYLSNCILVQYLHICLTVVVVVTFFFCFVFALAFGLFTNTPPTATNGIILKSFETT